MANPETTRDDRLDRHFLQLCQDYARMSKDPRTRVGAVIVGPDREIRILAEAGIKYREIAA